MEIGILIMLKRNQNAFINRRLIITTKIVLIDVFNKYNYYKKEDRE